MTFVDNTRLKLVKTQTMTRPVGGGQTFVELPKAGILMGILIPISVTIAGTLTVPNADGLASVIKRIRLQINAGQVIFDISGRGYFYLLSQMIQDNYNMAIYTNALAAVTAATFNLDIFIPVALNTRDEIGLIMLQSLQTFATLVIDWEADTTVATGATITGTASPELMIFEVPSDKADMPRLNTIHQVLEETVAISAAGDYDHHIPIGATLVGEYYLIPAGYSNCQLRLQSSNVIEDFTPQQHRLFYLLVTSRDLTLAGAYTGFLNRIFLDFAGSDGLGQFGSVRDLINTGALSDIVTRITMVGATTLTAVRRQIVQLT